MQKRPIAMVSIASFHQQSLDFAIFFVFMVGRLAKSPQISISSVPSWATYIIARGMAKRPKSQNMDAGGKRWSPDRACPVWISYPQKPKHKMKLCTNSLCRLNLICLAKILSKALATNLLLHYARSSRIMYTQNMYPKAGTTVYRAVPTSSRFGQSSCWQGSLSD